MEIEVKDLCVSIQGKKILEHASLSMKSDEITVLMGPNGSGKTTLGMAIMGYPGLAIDSGEILVDGKSILGMGPDERAKLGIFMQFQEPIEIEGVNLENFIFAAKTAQSKVSARQIEEDIEKAIKILDLKEEMLKKDVNVGFSGGEKKKVEIMQMLVLKPKFAILDEPDSGLDVDTLKKVAEAINMYEKESHAGILLITHYTRILSYINPTKVYVMDKGKIVASGGRELAEKIEREGYGFIEG